MDLLLVILIKDRLIMGDENELETAYRSEHSEAQRASECISCIVISVKSKFIFFESLDKRLPIFHNVLTFMTINVHAILMSPIMPP